MLPPGFITAAERYGLMNEIDRWMIETACRDYREGLGRAGAKLAINLSGSSLSDETLPAFIGGQLERSDVPSGQVCFEITETAGIQNPRRMLDLMTALKRLGCQLALDDFGSGLSSFRSLKTLPLDYVKIDGSFVWGVAENESDRVLVEAINRLIHTLGIETVAECAHSAAIVERLRMLGVDYAQGLHFGPPEPWTSDP
jgi:EAL domain-containing protein (putative c-di-GMP-specific phosphodiesterase class I)